MPDTETPDQLEVVHPKIDDLLAAKDKQETKLNAILRKLESLEASHEKTAKDVSDFKDGYQFLDNEATEVKSTLSRKGSLADIDSLLIKIEDLENRSKRNNIAIWGLREDAEKAVTL